MGEISWFRGEQGAVFSLTAPWPPDIGRRVAAGKITLLPGPPGLDGCEHALRSAERPAEVPVPDAGAPPNRGASRDEWERYALAQGMTEADLADMTRNQIANAMGSIRVAG
jgi:hypothetical protein